MCVIKNNENSLMLLFKINLNKYFFMLQTCELFNIFNLKRTILF